MRTLHKNFINYWKGGKTAKSCYYGSIAALLISLYCYSFQKDTYLALMFLVLSISDLLQGYLFTYSSRKIKKGFEFFNIYIYMVILFYIFSDTSEIKEQIENWKWLIGTYF